MKVVLDASVIIAFFDEIGDPDPLLLTRCLKFELMVPDSVLREDIALEPSVSILANCLHDGSVVALPGTKPELLDRFLRLHPSLGRGESEVILAVQAFMAQGVEALCVLDDKAARSVATRLGLPLVGTLGLLDMLVQANLIGGPEAERLKGKLRASRFRVDERLLR